MYSLFIAIFACVSVFRLRQWMMRDVEPVNAFYFFDRVDRKQALAGDHPTVKIHDLSSFETRDRSGFVQEFLAGVLKRAIDLVMSVILLIGLAPLLALTAIAIKLESPGPILYRQRRVGLHGSIFEVLKFRSMRVDAEKNGPQWASVRDDRITRVGRILRKLRIDEIPQSINVLRGEMSFVGPRPERPEFVQLLENEIPHYQSRHLVKPGITGWAQVKHQYTASIDGAREKLKYDLYYINKFSPILDIFILVLTVRVVLFGIGSR